MSRTNVGSTSFAGKTHEGGPARAITPIQELRRSVLACLLWEDGFYESGQTIAERIAALVPQCDPSAVAALAVEARSNMHLRHAPLFLVREMARHATHRPLVRTTLSTVIQRADELAEFLAIYWKDKKQPLAKSVQRGLADAFQKFNAYQLAKYNRDNPVKLRDVLFLSHAKPKQSAVVLSPADVAHYEVVKGKRRDLDGQGREWKQLIDGTLPTPDTWEVAISATKGKAQLAHDEWTRLLTENKLGPMALMRNLRNMTEAKVDDTLIRAALTSMKPDRVLPFRFIAAARIMPRFVPELDDAMMKNLAGQPQIPGLTMVLIDVSGSMDEALSKKSDMKRTDAAAGLGVIARELCQTARVFTFSDHLVEVSPYRGLALVEAVQRSQPHSGTNLGAAVERLNKEQYDRLIVITDEQSHDRVGGPHGRGYLINVSVNKPGVGYGPWFHIDGWSDRVLDYIRAVEFESANVLE
jgi:60 kDa SS-A/Ro ribonucleoprotein